MFQPLKSLSALFEKLMPRTEFGDKAVALKKFVRIHKRFPGNRILFNDVLYRLKTGTEISNPLRVFVSDKEFVKVYVKAIVGDQYNVPTLAILRSKSEVREFQFPDDCCIKPTHASGEVILRRNGGAIDVDDIASWLHFDYYRKSRERNYKPLHPKIIVEPLIFNEVDITDYRFFCHKGEVKLITLDVGKYSGYTRAFFTPDWVSQPFSLGYPRHEGRLDKPANLAAMIAVAEQLSAAFGFVRVDIYTNGAQLFVGEITHCHASACQRFVPPEAELVASKMIFGRE